MSFLVEIPQERYSADAMNGFQVASNFRLDNARAMMWMSQLAYETGNEATEHKVSEILRGWNCTMLDCISNPPETHLPLRTSCAVIAAGRDATIVTLAGTDPLKINDWITDFRGLPSADSAHTGFHDGVANIWNRISTALLNRSQADQPVFFTGHSLGGALAIIAADRALRELQIPAEAIYTFGSPRPGDAQFANNFDPGLRDRIYRLVDGDDLVATVGPSQIGFRHLGQMLRCPRGSRFSDGEGLLPSTNDEPDFVASFFDSILNTARMWLHGNVFAPIGPGALGWFFGLLPSQIRDHIPPSYFRALGL